MRCTNYLLAGFFALAAMSAHAEAWTYSVIHNFVGDRNLSDPDGYHPVTALIQDTNGNFWGTTFSGGTKLGGTVFEITP